MNSYPSYSFQLFNTNGSSSNNLKFISQPHLTLSGSGDPEHESFKGSLEDLVMITNFKRFKRKGSSSRYKGVFYVKKEKKFRAQICLKGKKKYVGTFKNDHDAALARDKKIREMFGEVEELLNFPASKQEQGGENSEESETNEISHEIDDGIHLPSASSHHHMKLNQITESTGFDNVRNHLSTLTRYGSSGSTLLGLSSSFPNLGGIENTLSSAGAGTADRVDQHQVHPGSNLTAFSTTQFNPYQNHYHHPGNMNVFNFQEVSFPKSKAVLSKRFSSNDSCFSFFPGGSSDFNGLGQGLNPHAQGSPYFYPAPVEDTMNMNMSNSSTKELLNQQVVEKSTNRMKAI